MYEDTASMPFILSIEPKHIEKYFDSWDYMYRTPNNLRRIG